MSKIYEDDTIFGSHGYGDIIWCYSGNSDATGFGDGKPYTGRGEYPADFEGFGTGDGSGYGPQIIYENCENTAYGDGSGYSSGYGTIVCTGGDLDESGL